MAASVGPGSGPGGAAVDHGPDAVAESGRAQGMPDVRVLTASGTHPMCRRLRTGVAVSVRQGLTCSTDGDNGRCPQTSFSRLSGTEG